VIGIWSIKQVVTVSSCASNTSMTVTPALSATATASSATRALLAYTTCPGSATYCTGTSGGTDIPPDGDLALTRLMSAMNGRNYVTTSNTTYKTRGDAWFATAVAGPADGPGGLLPCSGAGCSSTENMDTVIALPNCQTGYPPPCTNGGDVWSYQGKNYGQLFGFPASSSYLALRLGSEPTGSSARMSGAARLTGAAR
jgi:hypothetical protein